MNEKKILSPGPSHRKTIQRILSAEYRSPDEHALFQEIFYLRARLAQTKRWLREANKATARMSLAMQNMAQQVAYLRQEAARQRNHEWADRYSELQAKCDLLEDEVQTLKARYEHTQ